MNVSFSPVGVDPVSHRGTSIEPRDRHILFIRILYISAPGYARVKTIPVQTAHPRTTFAWRKLGTVGCLTSGAPSTNSLVKSIARVLVLWYNTRT